MTVKADPAVLLASFRYGDLVRIGPAYSMETRSASICDEITGRIGTVLRVHARNGFPEVALIWGDHREYLPPDDDHDEHVSATRCEIIGTTSCVGGVEDV